MLADINDGEYRTGFPTYKAKDLSEVDLSGKVKSTMVRLLSLTYIGTAVPVYVQKGEPAAKDTQVSL
ncbi:hypothetical protein O9929_17480 [Vibrio lentus]|nr:hypothetical protein [Vibrio lentus]